MQPDDKRTTERLALGLSGLLADTYVLYHSTQASHWNVEGPQFHSLHSMFEEQYRELAQAIDVIAERIRAIGFYTPGTLNRLESLSEIGEPGDLRTAKSTLGHLIEAHLQVIHRAHEVRSIAEQAQDEATLDLLVERLRVHEKTLWMLHSQAGQGSAELKPTERMSGTG